MAPALLTALLLALHQGRPVEQVPHAAAALRLERDATAEILKVVDGDTLDVRLDGAEVTLRLLSVDTEEKITGRAGGSPSKPQTVFGQETALWAREFFAGLGSPAQIGLAFPEGRRLDVYGRLLCEVLLPDGRDFNLLLVELGKSPYFNKYGNSLVAHEAFVRAQAAARAAELGIWNPATNRARTSGAPSAVRPYDALLPWWEARAEAIDAFRAEGRRRAGSEPDRWLTAEDAAGLARALTRAQADPELRIAVFAEIERFYTEQDGSLTVLLQGGAGQDSVRVTVPEQERAALEPELRRSTEEFRQNFWTVEGRLGRNARGYLLSTKAPSDWRAAAPAYPAEHAK